MAITIRVQNVQSIEDVTLVLDGFTVVTGANNSGKTALLRAIKGAFTNAPPGPLLRHGAAHLTVEIEFDDGTSLKWEKGWEKPGRKGKTVNRYWVNGRNLGDTVGRGVPAEVEALRVQQIQAGTFQLWPQVADQFNGTLFLVDSPGSAVAEAIANVDRVGKLGSALKLCESDRRTINSTLKVRRKDVDNLQTERETFDGLEEAGDKVTAIEQNLASLKEVGREAVELDHLRRRHAASEERVRSLSGADGVRVPDAGRATAVKQARGTFLEMEALGRRLKASQASVERLAGVDGVEVPSEPPALAGTQKALSEWRAIQRRWQRAQHEVSRLEGVADVDLPDAKQVKTLEAVKAAATFFLDVQKRMNAAQVLIGKLSDEDRKIQEELAELNNEVDGLITALGVCPACRRPTAEAS